MARRDAVNAAGLLDEQYQVPALAAYDYTVRMTRAGYGIASLPSVYVHHVESVHDQNQEEYDRQREKERESFHVKWNVSLDYSFYARIDLFPLDEFDARRPPRPRNRLRLRSNSAGD